MNGNRKSAGGATPSSLLPDGRRWRGAPDEGLPFQMKVKRLRCALLIGGGPSSLPFSHPGEGFPALYECRASTVFTPSTSPATGTEN